MQGTPHKTRTLTHQYEQHKNSPQRHAYRTAGHTHVSQEKLTKKTDLSCKALWAAEDCWTSSRCARLKSRPGLTPLSAARPAQCPASAAQWSPADLRTVRGIVIGIVRYRLLLHLHLKSLSPSTKLWRSRCS